MSASQKGVKDRETLQETSPKSVKRRKWRSKTPSKVWERVAWFTRRTKLQKESSGSLNTGEIQDGSKSPSQGSYEIEFAENTTESPALSPRNRCVKKASTKSKHSYLRRRKRRETFTSSWNNDDEQSSDDLGPATGTFHDFESDKKTLRERINRHHSSRQEVTLSRQNCTGNSYFNIQSCHHLNNDDSCQEGKEFCCSNCSGERRCGLQRSASFGGVGYYSWPRNTRNMDRDVYDVWDENVPSRPPKRCSNIRKMHTFHEKFTSRSKCSCPSKSLSLNFRDSQKDIVNQNGLSIGVIHYFKSPNCQEIYQRNTYLSEKALVRQAKDVVEGIKRFIAAGVNEETAKVNVDQNTTILESGESSNVQSTNPKQLLNIDVVLQEADTVHLNEVGDSCKATVSSTLEDNQEDLAVDKTAGVNLSICQETVGTLCEVESEVLENTFDAYEGDSREDNTVEENVLVEAPEKPVDYIEDHSTESTKLSHDENGLQDELVSMEKPSNENITLCTQPLETGLEKTTPEDLNCSEFGSNLSLPSTTDSHIADSQPLDKSEIPATSYCSLLSLEEVEKSTKVTQDEEGRSSTVIKKIELLKKPVNDVHRHSLSETDSGMESGLDDDSSGLRVPTMSKLSEEAKANKKGDKSTSEDGYGMEKKKSDIRRDVVRRSSSRRLNNLKSRHYKPKVDGIMFKGRVETILEWFEDCNDEQKNIMIKRVLERCGLPQMHMLSVAMEPVLHKSCPSGCQDMLAWLPYMLTRKILAYLDPVSLCRCAQVNKLWKNFVYDPYFWQRLCRFPDWQMSMVAERKQFLDNTSSDGVVQWKNVFKERFLLRRNWLNGHCQVRTFEGHTQGISCVQFDDTRIVSGSSDKTIKMWDIESADSQAVLTLVGHSGTVRCLNLNGNRLVSGSTDKTIKVWDLSFESYWTGASCKVTMVGHMHTVRCLQVDDDKVVSGSYDKTLKVWDLKTGHCRLTLRGHNSAVLCVQFDEKKIVSGSYDKTIKVWSLEEGTCLSTLSGHHDAVTCLNLTFDGAKVISGSLDHNLKFWDLSTGKCVSTLDWIRSEGHTGVIRCLQADNWRIVSAGDDKTLKVWSLESGQRLLTLRCHTDGVTCLQFTDYMIVSGSYDKTVKLWDFTPKSA